MHNEYYANTCVYICVYACVTSIQYVYVDIIGLHLFRQRTLTNIVSRTQAPQSPCVRLPTTRYMLLALDNHKLALDHPRMGRVAETRRNPWENQKKSKKTEGPGWNHSKTIEKTNKN